MLEGRGQRIIVVDSDRTVLELLQIRLEVAGYHAYVARTGQRTFELLQSVRPAAMILDLRLQETDAFEVLGTIRSRHPDQHFPILATGRGLTAEDVQRALGHGAQSCLLKPFGGTDVVERIGRLIQATRLQAAQPPVPATEAMRPAVYI
jgi:two-component system catabolic regulation response regulator CreB